MVLNEKSTKNGNSVGWHCVDLVKNQISSLCHLVVSETQVQLLEIHDQMSYKKMKFQNFFEVEYYIIKVHRILIIC